MSKTQRFRHEMLVRVRDFGTAHTNLFPESSMAGQLFAKVAALVGTVDVHEQSRALGQAEARKVKAATRKAVRDYMRSIALAARRVTLPEAAANPFLMPRSTSIAAVLAAARVFIAEAKPRQEAFARYGLPPEFISEFQALVDRLQEAADVRVNSRTVRSRAAAGIAAAFAEGLEVVRDLDVVVSMATRQDPAVLAAWRTARAIEGQNSAPETKSSKSSQAPGSADTPIDPDAPPAGTTFPKAS